MTRVPRSLHRLGPQRTRQRQEMPIKRPAPTAGAASTTRFENPTSKQLAALGVQKVPESQTSKEPAATGEPPWAVPSWAREKTGTQELAAEYQMTTEQINPLIARAEHALAALKL